MCGVVAVLLQANDRLAELVLNGGGGSDGHAEVDKGKVRGAALRLSKALTHRGPDWSGCWPSLREESQHPHVAFGHARLAIVRPESGAQPIVHLDGSGALVSVLVVNGEIYNYRDLLRNELSDADAEHLRSDCEVISMLYAKYGMAQAMEMLDGDYAFCLYDPKEQLVYAGRDRMGVDPLYCGETEAGSLMLASELKAIHRYCNKVRQVQPGALLTFSYDRRLQSWTRHEAASAKPLLPRFEAISPAASLGEPFGAASDEVLTQIRARFTRAVQKRMMSDVPYGVLLSGGLDSSLVASVANRLSAVRVEDGGRPFWPQLHSFSIGLEGSPDLAAAKRVADFIGTVHHAFTFTVQDGLDAVEDVIAHVETFDVTTIRASTAMFLLSRLIKAQGVKMVLSGEGADEIFGGYLYFHQAPSEREFHEETVRKIEQLHHYDVLRANKSSMAWGLEVRVPFLDADFMSYAMQPSLAAWKMICGEDQHGRKRIEKHVLRAAFHSSDAPYLPDDILWRQKEQFSDGVGYSWIDGLKEYAEQQVSDEQMSAAASTYPFLSPQSKEAYMYRRIFERIFGTTAAREAVFTEPSIACSSAKALEWNAKWKDQNDPSGLAMKDVHIASASDAVERLN